MRHACLTIVLLSLMAACGAFAQDLRQLENDLTGGDPGASLAALIALERSPGPEATGVLLRALTQDQREKFDDILLVLERRKAVEAVDPLIQLLGERFWYYSLKGPLERMDPNWRTRPEALRLYQKLLDRFNRNDFNTEDCCDTCSKEAAFEILLLIRGPGIEEICISVIKGNDRELHYDAIRFLKEIHSAKATDPIIELLDKPWMSGRDTGWLYEALDVMRPEWRSDPKAQQLLQAGLDRVIRHLKYPKTELLDEGWPAEQLAYQYSLCACPCLFGRFKEIYAMGMEDDGMHYAVLEGLIRTGGPKGAAFLLQELETMPADDLVQAAKLLTDLKERRIITPLLNRMPTLDDYYQRAILEDLGNLKASEALPIMQASLRRSIADCIAERQKPDFFEPPWINGDEPYCFAAQEIVSAISTIGTPQAMIILANALRDPYNKVVFPDILDALVSHGRREALKEALSSDSKSVRARAAYWVGRLRLNGLHDDLRPLLKDELPQTRAYAEWALWQTAPHP